MLTMLFSSTFSAQRRLLAGVLIVGAVFAAYFNSLGAPFIFDDILSIAENPTIRDLRSLATWSPPSGLTVGGRPVVNVSLAVNYAIGGTNVPGYHFANLCVHALAALTLFGAVRRTFLQPRLRARFGADATALGFGAALVWALHPLQTESVTYVIQRAEALMGLFYLLTIYCFIRSVGSARSVLWQTASVVVCAIGMATKEVMISAPLIVLLYDRVFVASSFRELGRLRWKFHALLAATWCLLAFLVWQSGDRAGTAGFSAGLSWWNYVLIQCRAIIHYLRLVVWPNPLVFDYGPYEPSMLKGVLLYAGALALLLIAGFLFCRRRPAVAFAGVFFFLVLAPTSSVLPIVSEPMAEHRMYLPLAALVVLGAAGLHSLLGRRAVVALTVLALGFGLLTFQRNNVYRTARTLWAETVRAAPKNPRAHSSLAWAFVEERDLATAETHFKQALALRPNYLDAHHGLARIFDEQGRLPEATEHLQEILRARPDDFVAHSTLGNIEFQLGHLMAAARHFENAVRVKPNSAPAHNNLGAVYYENGNLAAAKEHEETALRLDPNYAEAHYNLGNVLARLNRLPEARDSYGRALRLQPDYVDAHVNLASVLQSLGNHAAAIEHYRAALQLRPELPFAQKNLERLLAAPLR